MFVRDALERDLPAILDIYNSVVRTSNAIWTEDTATLADRQEWYAARRAGGFPVLVADDGHDTITGFGSYGAFRAMPGYSRTVEHSVHVDADHRGRGIGRLLLTALVERAQQGDLHVMVGAIDAENAVSLHLHEQLGFVEVARMPQVGRKNGVWLDLRVGAEVRR